LHIKDVLKLIDLQIHNIHKFQGKVFNAGGGLNNSVSLQEMTRICENITGNKINIESESKNRSADLRIYISDNTKIENEIGWKPHLSVTDIFSDIFSWIHENQDFLKNILK
jgi:CDP-paratose 2-epimerase